MRVVVTKRRLLTMEVLRDELVPQGYVRLTIVNDGAELCLSLQLSHEGVHTLDTLDEIDDALLVVLLVESDDYVLNSLSKDGGQALAHSRVSEGVPVPSGKSRHPTTAFSDDLLVVATVCRPWRVVRVNLKYSVSTFQRIYAGQIARKPGCPLQAPQQTRNTGRS